MKTMKVLLGALLFVATMVTLNSCSEEGIGDILMDAPSADFTVDNTTPGQGEKVKFTSSSTGTVDSYSWTFVGGTPATGTGSSVDVVYSKAGTYEVGLTVKNGGGSNMKVYTITVNKFGKFIDTRDNITYKTITIDGKTWLAENLNYYSASFTSYNVTGKAYGRYYDFNAAKLAVPAGWRLPTKADVEALIAKFGKSNLPYQIGGSSGLEIGYYGNMVKMTSPTVKIVLDDENNSGLFWTSTTESYYASTGYLGNIFGQFSSGMMSIGLYLNVRCIKN